MDQKRLEEIRKNVDFARKIGFTGLNMESAVYEAYCEIVPELLDYIKQILAEEKKLEERYQNRMKKEITEKEAIRLLHPDTQKEAILEYHYFGGSLKGNRVAIVAMEAAHLLACDALEKQISRSMEYDGWNPQGSVFRCPECLKILRNNVNYCPNCGQRIEE